MRLLRPAAVALLTGLMVAMPRAQPATPLRINAYASRHAGDGRMQITAVADLPAGTKWAGATISVLDERGAPITEWKAPPTLLSTGTLTATMVQDAGHYRLRITATDGARRTSTADCDVTATLTPVAGGLSVSPIAFGGDGSTFAPRGQFANEPQALARFELYGGRTGMAVSITMELAATADGPALAKLTPTITATPEPDRFIVTAPVSLALLAAGRYVVRAVAGIDGQPATTFYGAFLLGQRAEGKGHGRGRR